MNRWVLLHGFTGSPAAWDEVRAALPGAALCPALVGHAPAAGAATDFVAEIDRLASRIAEAGAAPAHLCGYSLGARLALGLLVRHPALFSRATLIGVHPGLPEHGRERAERAASDERWARLAESAKDEFIAQWQAQPLFATQQTLPPERLAAQARLRARHDGAALAAALRALSLARMPDWRPHLPQLKLPVHLIAGERDPKFVALAQQIAPQLPHASVTIVANAGHNVLLEQPAAIIAALTG